jgi:hypothetical protein
MAKKAKDENKEKAPSNGAAAVDNNGKVAVKKPRLAGRKPASPKARSINKEKSPVSDEAIRMRAYFISEERKRLALPGDANSDWIEARRQLLAELKES